MYISTHKQTIEPEHLRYFEKYYSSCRCIPLFKVLYCFLRGPYLLIKSEGADSKQRYCVRRLSSWAIDESIVEFETSGKEREANIACPIYTAADGGCPACWQILTGRNGHISALRSCWIHEKFQKINLFDPNTAFKISPRLDKNQTHGQASVMKVGSSVPFNM